MTERISSGEPDLVMAWAQRADTGVLCYILELDCSQAGARCGCACISCHLPLQAVNAGKAVFRQRPHFRHPAGAPRHSCLVFAARAAVLQALARAGTFILPGRRRHGKVVGLSGQYHEAWVDAPAEQISIAHVHFADPLTATLILDDGRELRVQLVGTVDVDAQLHARPCITIVVDDPAIAAMSFEDIRSRLQPLIEQACWRKHWDDDALQELADKAAREEADENLDFYAGNIDELGSDPAQRSESLLHLEVKNILFRHRTLRLPDLEITAFRETPDGKDGLRERIPEEWIKLKDVRLERKVGRTRPDVLAFVTDGTLLMVEVTVTNAITDERMMRIREQGISAIEIDVGRMGGRVTRTELERLVIKEVAAKRWLFHPRRDEIVAQLLTEIDAEVAARSRREEQLRLLRFGSVDDWADCYLEAFQNYADARALTDSGRDDEGLTHYHLTELLEAGLALSGHGYPEAEDPDFYNSSNRVMERILSIKKDKGVWYNLDTGWKVINAILQDRLTSRSQHTLYLIACRVYSPVLTDKQREKVETWRQSAVDSLAAGEMFYRRDRRFDRIISLFFPEMARLMSKPLPGELF
jgi:hypothetical protein